MGEDMEYGLETRFHLYRGYDSAPFFRYALTVERAHTPEGYEVLDHDPRVADTSFLTKFALQMKKPMERVHTGYIEGALAVTEFVDAAPGQYLHYGAAIRRLSGTTTRPQGRQA